LIYADMLLRAALLPPLPYDARFMTLLRFFADTPPLSSRSAACICRHATLRCRYALALLMRYSSMVAQERLC